MVIPTDNQPGQIETMVIDCIRVIARFSGASRVHLFFLVSDHSYRRSRYTWPNLPKKTGQLGVEPRCLQSPWWLHKLRQESLTFISDIHHLPVEVEEDRQALRSEGVHSLALLPVFDGKRLTGLVRIDDPLPGRQYNQTERDLLQIAVQLVVELLRVSSDIAALNRDHSHLTYESMYDRSTGLPNRRLFIDRLRLVYERDQRLFSVLLLGIENYHLLQERYGHGVGEHLMRMVVARIRSALRTTDEMARLDDQQISVLLEDMLEGVDGETVARRLLEVLNQPFDIDGHSILIHASVGIAYRSEEAYPVEAVVREAEIAMTQARHLPHSKIMVFNESLRGKLLERMELENDLKGSLDLQQLILHYQPIIALASGKLIGFEALVRWQHPQRGLIWPLEFITLSEETGLILPLGHWVLREACRQMRVWQEMYPCQPPLVVSVNISARQIQQRDFCAQVSAILRDTGLPPSSLRLEITESVMVEHTGTMTTVLDQLRCLGVQLYIDDFGTGYSSLGYLDSLPINAIKIDRRFVNNIKGAARSSLGVIQAIIQLAHELNIDVVAEGVETIEQHTELKRLHCEFAQGYYVSKPMDTSAVERYMVGKSLAGAVA